MIHRARAGPGSGAGPGWDQDSQEPSAASRSGKIAMLSQMQPPVAWMDRATRRPTEQNGAGTRRRRR